MIGDDVSLRLESVTGVVQSCIEHRHRIARAFRLGQTGSVPGDVDSVVFTDCHLGAANGPDCDGAARLRIHADGWRERRATVGGAGVEQVAVGWIAFEINQVQSAGGVDGDLRLNTGIGYAERMNDRCCGKRDVRCE